MSQVHVSLSTIPPRLLHLEPVLAALRASLRTGDTLAVYVPREYRRFGVLSEIPSDLTALADFRWVDEDLGPATKILPSARFHAGGEGVLVYCDDDRIPEAGWLEGMREEAEAHPEKVIVSAGMQLDQYLPQANAPARAMPRAKLAKKYVGGYLAKRLGHQIRQAFSGQKLVRPSRCLYQTSGHVDIAQGLGGVAVRPHFFDEAFYDIPAVAFPVDDIWLSANFARMGRAIWASNKIKVPREHHTSNESALVNSEFEGQNRHESDLNVVQLAQERFGVWTV